VINSSPIECLNNFNVLAAIKLEFLRVQ
jgi:hypothetical protein